ncbi:MAG: hypothetical protein ACJAVI_003427 [Candidatus Azotimanducaceae bacterium]|jgi:hypothetical protein
MDTIVIIPNCFKLEDDVDSKHIDMADEAFSLNSASD